MGLRQKVVCQDRIHMRLERFLTDLSALRPGQLDLLIRHLKPPLERNLKDQMTKQIPHEVLKDEALKLKRAYQLCKRHKGLTQEKLANICGWKSTASIRRLMMGDEALSYEALILISKALGVAPGAISPRLAPGSPGTAVVVKSLTVRTATPGKNGHWPEPVATLMNIEHFTASQSTSAIIFSGRYSPKFYSEWILIVDSMSEVSSGDAVVYEHQAGQYEIAKAIKLHADGGVEIQDQSNESRLVASARCQAITYLVRKSSATKPAHARK